MPLAEMPHEGTGATYVVLARSAGGLPAGRFANVLRFRVREIDPSTGERPARAVLLRMLPTLPSHPAHSLSAAAAAAGARTTPHRTDPTLFPRALHPLGEAEEDGYEDEYQLEDVELGAADYITPTYTPNFRAAWEELPEESEMVRNLALGRSAHVPAQRALVWVGGMARGVQAVPAAKGAARRHVRGRAGPGCLPALLDDGAP